jgi:phytoene synthase
MVVTNILETAKAGEPERYLAALLAPAAVRGDLLALAAFGAEMRQLPGAVREPMAGEIRLQWWRDVVGGFAGRSRVGHPVADALAATVARHELPLAPLLDAIEARAADLYDDAFPEPRAIDGYLRQTEAGLFALALQIVGATGASEECAALVAAAYGRARLLCALPAWLRRHRVPFADATLNAAGVDLEALQASPLGQPARTLLAEHAAAVQTAYSAARRDVRGLSRAARVAILPLWTTPLLLDAITRRTQFRDPIEIDPTRRIGRIAWAHLTGL